MASAIDATKPVTGNPTTESVRLNFAAAKSEIEILQQTAGVGPQGPAGATGPAGTVSVGSTTTGPAGSNATVTEAGTPQARVLNFVIPRGDSGTGGSGITETQAVDTVRESNPQFSEVPATTSPTWPTTPNVAQAPIVGAGWTPASGSATQAYAHDIGSAEPLAYPANISAGSFYQIIFTMTNVVGVSTILQNFFTVFFRNGPTVTTGQMNLGNMNSNNTLTVQATAAFTHLVIVPQANWQGTFTLTRIVAWTAAPNSVSLSVKDWPIRVRGMAGFFGGGGEFCTSADGAAFGYNALQFLTTGRYNVAFGHLALNKNTTGASGTAVGYTALQTNTIGMRNIAMGDAALQYNQTGNDNIALGYVAMRANIVGSNNIVLGSYALTAGVFVSNNTAVGSYAARYVTGSNNTVVGYYALVGGSGQMANANNIVAVGSNAGRYQGSGTGVNADGGTSVFLGAETRSSASGESNQIVIGYNALGGGSNTVTLGNDEITQLRCNVQSISALSDIRVKDDIKSADLSRCLQAVKDLKVHRWHWQPIAGRKRDTHVTGFLSSELKKVFPKAVTTADEYLTARDADGNPIYKTVTEVIEPDPDDDKDGALPQVQTRQILETVKVESLARVELTEILPTLWGAVQQLLTRIEALEKPSDNPSGNPGASESKQGFFRGKSK